MIWLTGLSVVGFGISAIHEGYQTGKVEGDKWTQYFGYSAISYFVLIFAPIIPPMTGLLSAAGDIIPDDDVKIDKEGEGTDDEPVEVEING